MDLWCFRAVAPVLRSMFAIEFAVLPLAGVGCLLRASRGEPDGSSLSFASPKESNQIKATLLSASLRCASGNLRCSAKAGSRANSPAAQTSTRPNPLLLALLGAYRRVLGLIRIRIPTRIRILGSGFPESAPAPAPESPVLAGPVMRQKSGIRAARCLSRWRVCADPRFFAAAQVA